VSPELWQRLATTRTQLDLHLNALSGLVLELQARGERKTADELARTLIELMDIAIDACNEVTNRGELQ
jgi:hypothetical protein